MSDEKNTVSILRAMVDEKEDLLDRMKQASYFISLVFLAGFVILIYMGQIQIIALISIFTLLISGMLFVFYKQLKKDVATIEELYFGYEINKRKKE